MYKLCYHISGEKSTEKRNSTIKLRPIATIDEFLALAASVKSFDTQTANFI